MTDIIPAGAVKTLDGLFRERVRRSPQLVAYQNYDLSTGRWLDYTWAQIEIEVARWQAALSKEGLTPGDRVAIMLRNCPEWVIFDQAALGLGLVVVPLYAEDRAENAAYILRDSGARLLLLDDLKQWKTIYQSCEQTNDLARVVTIESFKNNSGQVEDGPVVSLCDWLPEKFGEVQYGNHNPSDLATIIYTSGTSGRPKGVMLSHHNLLASVNSCSQVVPVWRNDLFLSFLPLSHVFERTVGYYLAIMGGVTVAYARSIQELKNDLVTVRPSLLISVPRVYERFYAAIHAKLAEKSSLSRLIFNLAVEVGYSRFEFQQQRGPWKISHLLWPLLDKLVAKEILGKLGGRLRLAMGGGAALASNVSRMFIGLGLPILQGYGMTECCITCVNRLNNNVPASVGHALPDVEVKLGENNALLIHGPSVMLGYWNNPEATKSVLSQDGWLNSGDMAHIDEGGRITITGRLKEIIVMSNGEKIPPVDMEAAIMRDPLFDQVMLIGEGRSYLSVLVVLDPNTWASVSAQHNLDPKLHNLIQDEKVEKIVLDRVAHQIREFPGYAKIHRAALVPEPWTVENGMLTSTLKLRREQVKDRYKEEVSRLYEGH